MDRRAFCFTAAAFAASTRLNASALLDGSTAVVGRLITLEEIERIDHERILLAANKYLSAAPITITEYSSPRSKGGKHDYFSEGDYWWPDPKNPSGPYIRRDGYSDPQNFNDHREALIRLSLIVPALTAAWIVTRQKRYAEHAAQHLRAWFVEPATRMNPSLQYAQAIWGVTPGRGTGIIDTLHLVEVSRAARHLEKAQVMAAAEFAAVRTWFAEYLDWMRTSKNGQDEEKAKNNHGTCWVAQAAAFAAFTGNNDVLALCRERFRDHLLPDQMAANGSFPLELARTKPYSYSLFDLDMLSVVCQIASTTGNSPDNLWQFSLPNGNRYQKAVDFMYPYIMDKSKWPFAHDVEYFDDLPNRQPSLLFAGLAYREPKYIALWRTLPPDPKTAEIIRNFPIRQPVLWVETV
jgi:Alginate lyase